MMIGPSGYIEEFKQADYFDLITERDRLVEYLKNFEKKEITGDRLDNEWEMKPGPDVRYQVYLDYLSELCKLMREKYNAVYIWGDHSFVEDYKKHIASKSAIRRTVK